MPATGDILAAIDVGTNTTRLLVARVDDGAITVLARGASMTALGKGLEEGGSIAPDRLALVSEVARRMAGEAREIGAARLVVACTAIARDAANSDELLARLREATDVEPRVVTGEEEAQLTFRGLVAAGAPDPLLACDLGGGSLEVMGGSGGRLEWAESLPVGTRRITERFRLPDPPPLDVADAMVALAAGHVEPVARGRSATGGVAAGGSAVALGTLAGSERLGRAELLAALERMAAAPTAQVARETGVSAERVRLSFAGAAILEAVRRAFDLDALLVSEAGMREGLLLEMAAA
jgi:exopolyphosphatase / guanosine-5'-triphosphate,3'-diphosphate pyrophosphatase